MKNFFKKLSFVMALAMVLTALAPAVAGADASYIYKRGNDTQKEAVEVWFGDAEAKRDLNVKINGKKTTDGEWKIGNKKIATIDENGVVTPVKNGTTTAKFTAEDGTVAKVKVVVGTRAAGIKVKDNGTAITELAMTVGEEKELKFGAYISKKAKNAGATKSSQDVAFTVEGEAVTTAQDGKYVTVTAAKAGEATITFTAGKKTTTLAITVVDSLAAKQTGATKITVTGSDLSDKVADYVVKRGNVTVAMAGVTLNADKTEAVLVASASVLPKGEYTLSYKAGEAVAFAVEQSKVAAIEILGDTLALAGEINVATQATVSYKVVNQFGENITDKVATVSVNTSFGTATPNTVNGKVTVNLTGTTIIGTLGTMVIIDTTTGVNTSKNLTLGQMAKVASFEVKGVYNTYAKAELPLQERNPLNGAAVLLVAPYDQYGNRLYSLNAVTDAAVTLSAGLTGITIDTNTVFTNTVKVDGVSYVALPIGGTAKAGTATVFFVSKTTGNNATATITVNPTTTVQSIDVYPIDTVYENEDNEFGYVALAADGTEVTDFATLNSTTYGISSMPAGFRWVKNLDGSAKLVYNADVQNTVLGYTTTVATFMTAGYGTKTISFNVYDQAVPNSVGGTQLVTLGKVVGSNNDGNVIDLYSYNFVIYDQYGRAMNPFAPLATGYELEVTALGADNANITEVLDNPATVASITVTTGAITTAQSQTYRVVLKTNLDNDPELEEIAGSDNTFTVTVAPMSAVTSVEMKEIKTMYITANSKYEVKPVVTGTLADGTKVAIDSSLLTLTGQLNVVDGTKFSAVSAGALLGFGETKKDVKVIVTVNDKNGTVLTQTVTADTAVPTLATANFDIVSTVSNAAILADVMSHVENAKDQYGVAVVDNTADVVSYYVSDIDSAQGKVDKNNTANLSFIGTWAANDLFTITVTYKSGLTLTKTFKIQ